MANTILSVTPFEVTPELVIPVADPSQGNGLKNGSVTVEALMLFFAANEVPANPISNAPVLLAVAGTATIGISIGGVDGRISLALLAQLLAGLTGGVVSAPGAFTLDHSVLGGPDTLG